MILGHRMDLTQTNDSSWDEAENEAPSTQRDAKRPRRIRPGHSKFEKGRYPEENGCHRENVRDLQHLWQR